MFTGIVKEIGTILNIQPNEEGKLITIDLKSLADKANIDDSVCVNGVCQTVIEKTGTQVKFQAVGVTLEKTNFSDFQIGDKVNLETSLTASDQLGGHFVMGHVNGVSEISEVVSNGDNYYTWINLPEEMKPYLVQEGSISVDGVSLTIAEVNPEYSKFAVSLIPHTWENTVFHSKKVGSKVNLEVDILAKYIENLLKHRSKSISLESLKEAGF
ncbi:MAG: riboflavin synthase [Bacteriovoracaceae bacterium]|nr:riboflavin synthase [Bacteriovoracaceae bacterium]